jgi:hypothetical protein
MSQSQRDRVMNKFRTSSLEFLMATDVAARYRGRRLGEVPPFQDPLHSRADGPALAGTLSISQCTARLVGPVSFFRCRKGCRSGAGSSRLPRGGFGLPHRFRIEPEKRSLEGAMAHPLYTGLRLAAKDGFAGTTSRPASESFPVRNPEQ